MGKHIPIAVTTRTVEAQKKIVKILSGITEVLLIPSGGSMKVMVNGKKSADLKTPRMCVLPPHLAALSFIVNKSGSAPSFERCSGIPAALKPEFVRLSTE